MYTLIALSLLALFVFPLLAYAAIWFDSRRVTGGDSRPEPRRHREARRKIPGGRSDHSR